MGVVGDNAHDPASKKFLRRFFQKAATFFSSLVCARRGLHLRPVRACYTKSGQER
jgi:hypothetical protein